MSRRKPHHNTDMLTWDHFPCAPTLFRSRLLPGEGRKMLVETMGRVHPETLERSRPLITRIEQAQTPEAVLDLAVDAKGLADPAWYQRVAVLGPEVVPLIVERLQQVGQIADWHRYTSTCEHLIGALSLYGRVGIPAVLSAWDAVDDYGRSLACVVLGRLDAHASADQIWAFYQHVRGQEERHFVGALWGLIDLHDPRAGDALTEQLWDGRVFFEAFAMAHRVGDERVVLPLFYLASMAQEEGRMSAARALTSVAHRIGREAMMEVTAPEDGQDEVNSERHARLVEMVIEFPQSEVDDFFAVFYEGLRPEDVNNESMTEWMEMFDRLEAVRGVSGELESLPDRRPGRNDPCWCGSGKKYKHCHWRNDQRYRSV